VYRKAVRNSLKRQKLYQSIDNTAQVWYNKTIINPTSLLFFRRVFSTETRPFFAGAEPALAHRVGEYSGEDGFTARGAGAPYRMTLASRASSLLWGGDSFLMGCKVEGANFWGVPPKKPFPQPE
jgi:hypothetical protein